jgi:hypothetical protein
MRFDYFIIRLKWFVSNIILIVSLPIVLFCLGLAE